jgi:2-oxoglutarate dehydrogenase E2 component (dihydrolipoamide succinyltransferase)
MTAVQARSSAGTKAAPAPASQAAAPAPAPASSVLTGARTVRRERMTQLRQRIAQRLVEAQHTAAMLTTFNECDMSAVIALRAQHKDAFEKKHGVGLGFMSFFVKAVSNALRQFPAVNASIVTDDKGELGIEYHDYCDIAIAVGTPKGLVVPVLRSAETLSFAQIEQGIKDLALKAKDNKLTLADLQGGTFTITNGGIYGSLMSTPILNPPQCGILGMHAIKPRAIEHPVGSGQVAIRPMMYLALSYDHRLIDGAEAVQFLVSVKNGIEQPERLLIGM